MNDPDCQVNSLRCQGIFQIKYLYAEHVYEWGAEQVGLVASVHRISNGADRAILQLSYYITWMGGVRAVHLLFVMPCTSPPRYFFASLNFPP